MQSTDTDGYHTQASLGPDDIEEYASMVVLQVGQVVREVGEVVADAGPEVLANATIQRSQDAAVVLIEIRQAKLANFSQGVPLFEEAPVNA